MAQVPSVLVYFWTLYKNLPKLVSVPSIYFDLFGNWKHHRPVVFLGHFNSTTQLLALDFSPVGGTLKLLVAAPLLLDDVEEWCRKCTTLFCNPPWQRGLFKNGWYHPSISRTIPNIFRTWCFDVGHTFLVHVWHIKTSPKKVDNWLDPAKTRH